MIQVKHWDVKQITVFFKLDRSADCWSAPKRPEPAVFFSSFGSTTEMRTHPVKYAQARYCLLESEYFCPLFAPLWASGILQGGQLKTYKSLHKSSDLRRNTTDSCTRVSKYFLSTKKFWCFF